MLAGAMRVFKEEEGGGGQVGGVKMRGKCEVGNVSRHVPRVV